MNKIIIYLSIILISIALCYSQRPNYNLYAITTQGNNASNLNLLVIDPLVDKVLKNQTFSIPSNLSMQAITNINFQTSVITLLCMSNNPNAQGQELSNLIDYNINTGEQFISYSNSFEPVGILNVSAGYQNYIVSSNDHVYLVDPFDYNSGISLIDLYFEDYNSSNIPSNLIKPSKELLIQDTNDMDIDVNPIGTIRFEDSSLIMVYQSNQDAETVATLIIGNLNGSEIDTGSDSSSGSLVQTEIYKIKLYDFVYLLSQVYTDHFGNIYLVSNQSVFCMVNLISCSCDIIHSQPPPVFTSNFNYSPYIVTQNKQSIISISPDNSNGKIQYGIWGYNWGYSVTYEIQNYWSNNLQNSYTYFAV